MPTSFANRLGCLVPSALSITMLPSATRAEFDLTARSDTEVIADRLWRSSLGPC